jgi:type 1 glutamine amidotransferase
MDRAAISGSAGRTLLLAVAAALVMAAGQAREGGPAAILVVTGHDGPWHDWKTSTPALREVLEQDGRFRVDVLEDPHAMGSADLDRYRAVILHFSAGELKDASWKDPGEEARRKLEEYVRRGGGLFILHFASFAFRDWPGFEALAGRVWDRVNGHDRRGPFRVEVRVRDHPACGGLDSFDTDDELYTCLKGDLPVEVLAEARSRNTGKNHPMAFVHRFGESRVFHTPLGHDARAIRMPGAARLIRGGAAWAARLEGAGR